MRREIFAALRRRFSPITPQMLMAPPSSSDMPLLMMIDAAAYKMCCADVRRDTLYGRPLSPP